MSVSGLCQICQSRSAERQCDRCGTLACEEHYDLGTGVCADCATELRKERRIDQGDVYRF